VRAAILRGSGQTDERKDGQDDDDEADYVDDAVHDGCSF
jgi:hypothetical protein